MSSKMELAQRFKTTHFFSRTSQHNLDKFYEALNLSLPATSNHVENKKLDISHNFLGDWTFRFDTESSSSVSQFTVGETCRHKLENLEINGTVTRDNNIFTFQGRISSLTDPEHGAVCPQVIISWELSPEKVIQTSTVMWSTGLTGVFVDCKEIYELDYELMYRSDYRQNMRKYIDTKLPALCVRQPNRVPVPDSWCLCHDDDEEGGDNADNNGDQERFNVRCMVHGSCDECEEANAVCNCDWWYDQHYCTTCGMDLTHCDCVHMSELMEKLYEF